MSLSDKRFNGSEVDVGDNVYGEGDVKQFIKELNKFIEVEGVRGSIAIPMSIIKIDPLKLIKWIREKAGKELIKEVSR